MAGRRDHRRRGCREDDVAVKKKRGTRVRLPHFSREAREMGTRAEAEPMKRRVNTSGVGMAMGAAFGSRSGQRSDYYTRHCLGPGRPRAANQTVRSSSLTAEAGPDGQGVLGSTLGKPHRVGHPQFGYGFLILVLS